MVLELSCVEGGEVLVNQFSYSISGWKLRNGHVDQVVELHPYFAFAFVAGLGCPFFLYLFYFELHLFEASFAWREFVYKVIVSLRKVLRKGH